MTLAETASKRSGDRIRPAAAFAALYESLAQVNMNESVADSATAAPTEAPEAKVIYVGNFQE